MFVHDSSPGISLVVIQINDYITNQKIMVVADRLSEIVKMQVKPFE